MGQLLKERIFSLAEQIPSFKSTVTPKFEVIQLAPLNLRIKKIIFICQGVWKKETCQGKIREKSGNFEVDDKWQPCLKVSFYCNVLKYWDT